MEPSPGALKHGRHYLKADDDDPGAFEDEKPLRGEGTHGTKEPSIQLLSTGRHYLKAEED